MLGAGTAIVAGLALMAKAVRAIREKIEADEERATEAKKAAHTERVAAIKEHARLRRDGARRKFEYESRALLLDQLSRIQARARTRKSSVDGVLASAKRVRSQQLERWIAERRASSLPADEIDALRVEFRQMEALLCRKEYMRQRMFDLISDASTLKHELTSRSVYFRDAERFKQLLPDEMKYLDVPKNLPKRYDTVIAECRPTVRGFYFKLPCGLKGLLREDESAPRSKRGAKRPVYVWRVDYRAREAVVSAVIPRVLRAYESDPNAAFSAQVTDIHRAGAKVVVKGQLRAFLPRSRFPSTLEAGQKLQVWFQHLDAFLDSPVVLPVPSHADDKSRVTVRARSSRS